jgi:hypothetical protein
MGRNYNSLEHAGQVSDGCAVVTCYASWTVSVVTGCVEGTCADEHAGPTGDPPPRLHSTKESWRRQAVTPPGLFSGTATWLKA